MKSLKYCKDYPNVRDKKGTNAVGKGVLTLDSRQDCHKPSAIKKYKTVSAKHSKAKHKTRYACRCPNHFCQSISLV